MLDAKLLRNDLEMVAERLKTRGVSLDVRKIQTLEEKRKNLQIKVQELRNERNLKAKLIGTLKAKGEDIAAILEESKNLNESIAHREEELITIQTALDEVYWSIPNLPHETTPIGSNERDNVEVRRIGTPREFGFEPKSHADLGVALHMMDFDAAAKITGSRFVVLSSQIARLQRALIQFMLDLHTTKHNYIEVYVPHLVNAKSLYGTGQLPKFKEDLFHLGGTFNYSLIPTAEVPVTNLVRERILNEEELPLKFVAHTPCYRSEAGSYGKDLIGMIRQHQFEKVELVQIVTPERSYEMHEALTRDAEEILRLLKLPYRVMALCSGDIGFSSAKTYDLEVWLPAQRVYREISSCSNFEAFQARRMQARFRTKTGEIKLVHTLNGSGLAVGRTLVAILENYQEEDGTIRLPEVLWPYMGGTKVITKS